MSGRGPVWLRFGLGFALAGLLASACVDPTPTPTPDEFDLEPVEFTDLLGWSEGGHGAALGAFQQSCRPLLLRADERSMGAGGMSGTVADWRGPCEEALALDPDALDDALAQRYFETAFTPFLIIGGGEATGLFTGYFEPELRGSLTPDGQYGVPLYARPPELVTVDLGAFRSELAGERLAGRVEQGRLLPFEDRAAIGAGALAGRGLELVWIDDPVAAFFLQIQGSGRIVFEDGSARRIGYAASNGHPYYAIGRDLVARGVLDQEEVSLQLIRNWLDANAPEATSVMALNASYIFFRWLPGDGSESGPLGAAGVPLTPGRSLAVDNRFIPLGAPLWLESSAPAATPGAPDERLRRLVIAQDTGGAIRGPVRGDLYWGAGADAEWVAGHMRSSGRLFLLLPRHLAVLQQAAAP